MEEEENMSAEFTNDSDNDLEQELYEHYSITADKGQQPLRIDKFLMNRIENASRTKIQAAASAGNIRVNERAVKSNYKVKAGDKISIVLPYPPREIELIPQDLPLEIVYEDEDLLVVNKEAGMVVHPGYGNYSGTLVNALVYHFENLPNTCEFAQRPGLVHRIDKLTTGLLVIAKNEQAMTHLAKQFFDRTIERRYQAIAWGDIEEDGTIRSNLARSLKNRKVMDVFPEGGEIGKHAVTHYKVLKRFGYITLLEFKLETGRTHQIRIHSKSIGHPLFNDPEYDGNRIVKGTHFTKYKQFVENCFDILPRQALHAKSLAFTHPRTGEWMSFNSELPEDMQQVLAKWDTYAQSAN